MSEHHNAADQKQTPWHSIPEGELVSQLAVARIRGLSSDEALRRLSSYGPNSLPEKRKKSLFVTFLSQFQNPLIYLLLAAAVVAIAVGEGRDSGVIVFVMLINALLGTYHEGRAERSMEALRQITKLKARVIRDGKEELIEAGRLVPGDILVITAGDTISADARLLEVANIEVGEAALTGESNPVRKRAGTLLTDTLLADRRNMVYAATHVTTGRGTAVVVATGQMTEVGKIAGLTEAAQEPRTPLETRIAHFGQYLIFAAIVLFGLILALGLFRDFPFHEIFMTGISQVVSMVPEGLPVAMTVALAIGVQRMAARNAIVRKLAAVETLGSTSVICTDKTGTLTRNGMTVTAIYLPPSRTIEVSGVGYLPEGEFLESGNPLGPPFDSHLTSLLLTLALCNDAQLRQAEKDGKAWSALGDPTEAALLTLAMKGGMDLNRLKAECPRESELPFDPNTKLMATQNRLDSQRVIFIKGAPEAVLELCSHFQDGPQKRPLGREQLREFRSHADEMAGSALRVLGAARIEGIDAQSPLKDFRSLGKVATFTGLIGQLDPPRAEVAGSVSKCRLAGIRPVMVTGDHKATGWAIARTLGIADDQNIAMDGRELDQVGEDELTEKIERVAVFARVHPAQKLRIVKAFQAKSAVVAMTGDGVNDAPALARADVGVAMGITGTEVAKEASKVIITDDNFATIVDAVEEGRLIYRNLKKLILYLFSTSASEIIVLIGALILGCPPPLEATQILWINLVTDGAVTVTLIMEPPEGDEMTYPPIPRAEPLLTKSLLRRMAFMSPAIAISTLGYFIYRTSIGIPFIQARTEAFTVLAVSQWFNALNCRSDRQSVFKLSLLKNKWLAVGIMAGAALQACVIYIPWLNELFHTVPLPIREALLVGLVSSFVLWVEEIRKWVASLF